VGAKMQESWGQPVVVDNKPGGNSIIATEFVAKSAADGYTLLVNANGGMTINPLIYAKLPYDPQRDFVPISTVGIFPMLFVVNPSIPAGTLQEFIAYARANRGKLNYSAGSTAFQLATEMFKQITGTDIRHIPYKGSAQAVSAVLSGDTQMTLVDSTAAVPLVKSGRLRALAVTSAHRVGSMPELPTMSEAGAPGYEMILWVSFFAPAGTPGAIISKLNTEIVRIVRLPDIHEKLLASGVEPLGNTSEQLAELISSEIARYRPVIQGANIKVE
jgi:tripartite-type tricarboxylate transporter receptor subunit TctC